MVIERFKPGAAAEIYRRVHKEGRHLVDGLEYVASWVDVDFATCWQIMTTDDRALLEGRCAAGRQLVDFEIVPIRTSAEAAAVMAARDAQGRCPTTCCSGRRLRADAEHAIVRQTAVPEM